MKQVYHTYLSIIKKNCTDSECKIVVPKEEYSQLIELAKKQCTLPFLLPYFRDTPYFLFLKQQTKHILPEKRFHYFHKIRFPAIS